MRSGIKDPLRELPDMHSVLNFVEAMWTEHMDEKQLQEFNRELYRVETLNADGEVKVIPSGFERDDEMASFDAFAQLAGD